MILFSVNPVQPVTNFWLSFFSLLPGAVRLLIFLTLALGFIAGISKMIFK